MSNKTHIGDWGKFKVPQATHELPQDLVAQSDGRARIRFHPVSKWTSLQCTVLSWFHAVGVRPVLLEICSCYHRILLRRKIGSSLSPEAVRQSLPSPATGCDSASQIGRHSCIEGIQALQKERPWLPLPDIELFLQGWFGAERCASDSLGTGEDTSVRA